MPKLSPAREAWPTLDGLEVVGRDNVRDYYRLPEGRRLVVTTDGISAEGLSINGMVPDRGIFLNCMNIFWMNMLSQYGVNHHVVAYGSGIDEYLPENLRGNVGLQSRAIVALDLDMCKVSFVVQRYLDNIGLRGLLQTGKVHGNPVPLGDFGDGDELPYIMETPMGKSETGHNLPLAGSLIRERFSAEMLLALKVYQIGSAYAAEHGIIIAGTTFRFGARDGDIYLADEVLTPDSSPFWLRSEWKESRRQPIKKAPSSFDRDPVRQWFNERETGWLGQHPDSKGFDPASQEHVDAAHSWEFPPSLSLWMSQADSYLFWRLTGMTINLFLKNVAMVNVLEPRTRKVKVICQDKSDLVDVLPVCEAFGPNVLEIEVSVISPYWDPENLRAYVQKLAMPDVISGGVDAIVCVGSKAFALPGMVDAWLYSVASEIPVVGVALGEPGSDELLTAQLSIWQLPRRSIVWDEVIGCLYTGGEGLGSALTRIAFGELLPSRQRHHSPAEINVWTNIGPKSE